MPIAPYRVFACRYAMREAKRHEHFLEPIDNPDASMPMDYFVWVAISEERTIVIDVGFNAEVAVQRGRVPLRRPAEALRLIGVDPASVEDIVITHMHYDHVGTVEDFPRARFHAHAADMAFVTGPAMQEARFRVPYETEDIEKFTGLLYQDRLVLHDVPFELAPGLSVHHLGGHTPGVQVVRVFTERGWIVLASDTSHYYENMETNRVFSISHTPEKSLAAFSALRALADSPQHIIPGHDPMVLQRYPAPSPDLEGIVVRLDVPPF